MRARDVLGPGSPLSRLLPQYEHRAAQLAMAEAVEGALEDEHPLFVEAGTGTGKTLAYLVPAVLSGKKVVVSTATKALQDQIFAKDIPLLAQALAPHGVPVRAALMKGLANYLCKRRFAELRASPRAVAGSPALTRMLGALERWALSTEEGDRAELSQLTDDAEIWQAVQSSSETRIGSACRHYEECFVTRMRRAAEDAQIVVVNHHLFLADLALRTGKGEGYASVLPNYDAVVFDEAHQLEDVATAFFGVRLSSARIAALLRDAERSLTFAKRLDDGARALLALVDRAQAHLFGLLSQGREGIGRAVLSPDEWTPQVHDAHVDLDSALHALETFCAADRDEAVAQIARRAEALRADLADVVRGWRSPEDEDEHEARVVWIEARARRELSVAIGASPIHVGPALRGRLFDRVGAVVCTSATLATGRGGPAQGLAPSFHFAKARLGAPPETRELVAPSPFDYARRAALYVPRDLPEPSDARFEREAVERVIDLVTLTEGGAFVLCTSARAMNAIGLALRGRVGHPLFVQGEAPKAQLLARFRASGSAVLVATMSFWEGVDVPGRALRLVILDKIPFAVPTDPVVRSRCERIDREGGNSFAQYSVPSAAITLKQGFGRLIRTESDTGIVSLLDKRILTRGYGRALLASLPPARRASSLDDLRAFWASLTPEPEAASSSA